MTSDSRTYHPVLRRVIRGLLREADLAGKPMELVTRLVRINQELLSIGSPRRVGISVDSDASARGGDQAFILSFAVRAEDYASAPIWRLAEFTRSSALGVDSPSQVEKASQLGLDIGALQRSIPYGMMQIRTLDEEEDGSCSSAMVVEQTYPTLGGWGPLLYDLAIEIASQRGGGLTSDRGSVSPDARSVWAKYDTARGDVKSAQLDISWPKSRPARPTGEQLTPDDPSDDCDQSSAIRDAGVDRWFDSPMSRVYSKSGQIMAALKREDLLWGNV